MKTIVMTGASRGLGLAITKKILAEGYFVVALARTMSDELKDLLENTYPEQIVFEPYDLAKVEGIGKLVSSIVQKVGPLYGLINNAAVGYDGILPTQHDSAIEALIKINTHAPILLSKYCSRSMLLFGSGRIINISSIIASTGYKGIGSLRSNKSFDVRFYEIFGEGFRRCANYRKFCSARVYGNRNDRWVR